LRNPLPPTQEPWLNKPRAESERDGFVLHPDLLNPRLLDAQYAVRGELYLRAEALKESRPIIYTNGEQQL
jgi:glutamate--glyoxylate aminotransferase